MEETIEVRKISTKTFVYMGIIALLGVVFFYVAENGKASKAAKILNDLGYKEIADVSVYSVTQFENIDTKIQGYKYFVKFTNRATNEECEGFIIKDFKHNIDKDLTCTKPN